MLLLVYFVPHTAAGKELGYLPESLKYCKYGGPARVGVVKGSVSVVCTQSNVSILSSSRGIP